MKNLAKNLSFEVVNNPIKLGDQVLSDYQALSRSDNGHILNVTKKSYTPFSNSDFEKLVNDVSNVANMEIEGYQEYDGGKKVIAYLINTNNNKILDYDIKDYLVVANSHDSSTGLFITSTSTMIRCDNQWSRLKKQQRVLSAQHSEYSIKRAINFPHEIEIFNNLKKEEIGLFEKMSKVKIDQGIIDSLVNRLLDVDRKLEGKDKLSTKAVNIKEKLLESIYTETNDLGNNLFGFFHGVTHYTTHKRNEKENSNALFGSSKIMNDKAMLLAYELI